MAVVCSEAGSGGAEERTAGAVAVSAAAAVDPYWVWAEQENVARRGIIGRRLPTIPAQSQHTR